MPKKNPKSRRTRATPGATEVEVETIIHDPIRHRTNSLHKIQQDNRKSLIIWIVTLSISVVVGSLSLALFLRDSKQLINKPDYENDPKKTAKSQTINDRLQRKEIFLKWFIDNGGIFHDVISHSLPNVTLEEFSSFGGWGLAVTVPKTLCTDHEDLLQTNFTDNDESRNNGSCTEGQCSNTDKDADSSTLMEELSSPFRYAPIIKHLDPLLTIPSSIIVSVQSVLDTYAKTSSPLYLSNLYDRVNEILKRAHPYGPGLTAKADMGLVEQDVVMAMFLMAEECQHRNRNLFTSGSRWGPYLDVLPQQLIPRLDSFGKEEYAALNDDALQNIGLSSKRMLQQMFFNRNDTSRSTDPTIMSFQSLQSVVHDMIMRKLDSSTSIPKSCITFDSFHKFVAIISSRAMVLKGVKYLTPMAEMINYAPKPVKPHQQESQHRNRIDWMPPPYDLYHALSDDNAITVRSDRDVFVSTETIDHFQDKTGAAVIQLFEDYGPVDSSLFLEAHGFVPYENPYHCVVISGSLFLTTLTNKMKHAAKEFKELFQVLKILRLLDPQSNNLHDVCVRKDLTIVEDGSIVGRKPASDSIAIAALLLQGDSNLKKKCVYAIESEDVERIEIQCARYPESEAAVRHSLRVVAQKIIYGEKLWSSAAGFPSNIHLKDTEMKGLISKLQNAQSEKKERLELALRFRIEDRRLLTHIAESTDNITVYNVEDNIIHEKSSTPLNLENKLNEFNDFIESLGLPLNKIEPRIVSNGLRIGAFAKELIKTGDPYLILPTNSVFDANAIEEKSGLRHLVRNFNNKDDGFTVLLLQLLYERFVLKESSRWWRYLNVLPSIEEMSRFHPLFWPEEEINKNLAGSDVRRFIFRYQQRTSERHKIIISDLEANLFLGSVNVLDGRKMLWASAIIDSRSIWWGGTRHLVPLLDFVNADILGKPHETRIEVSDVTTGQSFAVTKATRSVEKDMQLYENYGQPNYALLVYHGFLLEDNPNDCALMEMPFHTVDYSAPIFCIRDLDSVRKLEFYIRSQNNIHSTNAKDLDVSDDIRDHVIKILDKHISRLKEFIRFNEPSWNLTSSRASSMLKIVKLDLSHFEHALNAYVLPKIKIS